MSTGVLDDRGRIADALASGWRFAGLHAAKQGTVVRTLLVDDAGRTRLESRPVTDGECASLVELAPAAGWDEREAHDLYGIGFAGHDPLRPLVDHDPNLAAWVTPVRGHDPYQIAVGPIHAGVIESGHFRFHVVGDRILHLDPRLFYKHRGLEQAAEGHSLTEGLAYIGRACAACTVANTLAYTHACEETLGLDPTPELARARTILAELERTWNHLNDIGAICAGVGFTPGNNHFAALTERARRLNADLTGHRFLFATIELGQSSLDLDWDAVRTARSRLDDLRDAFRVGWRALRFDHSFRDRLPGVGALSTADARSLGTVGPAARASGMPDDARAGTTRLAYDGFQPALQATPAGDVEARLEQRAVELEQTFTLLDELLARPLRPALAHSGNPARPIGIGRVESPRGATHCILEQRDGRVERVHLRTGSYANWPSVAHAAANNLLPDFPLINKSFELCYACADR